MFKSIFAFRIFCYVKQLSFSDFKWLFGFSLFGLNDNLCKLRQNNNIYLLNCQSQSQSRRRVTLVRRFTKSLSGDINQRGGPVTVYFTFFHKSIQEEGPQIFQQFQKK